MLQFLRRFVFAFNIVAAILLIGAYLATVIDPKEMWLFAILGLAYPLLLLLNVFFILFWLFQLKWQIALSLLTILFGFTYFRQTFQWHTPTISQEKSDLKVLSYNAALFGYFQSKWYVPELIETLETLDADVVCIQEVLNFSCQSGSTIDSLKLGKTYPYAAFKQLKDGRKKGVYGMLILSKHPIINSEMVHFDGLTGNMCFYADVQVASETFRVYNVHLQSFKFRKQDFQLIEDMPEDNQEKLSRSKGLLKRMKYAYLKRSEQVETITEHMKNSPFPHFVVGDFNDPPVSFAYHELSRGLSDAFIEKGWGMGKTYIGNMPNFRIDYILHPKSFEAINYQTYQLSSDHSLICTGLKYKKE